MVDFKISDVSNIHKRKAEKNIEGNKVDEILIGKRQITELRTEDENIDTRIYKRRPGTLGGKKGFDYECKQLGLIFFRLLKDDDIEHFCLGTNINDIGTFDDNCFKYKLKGTEQNFAAFIQFKFKESNKDIFKFENKNSIETYFESYLKTRYSFAPNRNDELFHGEFNETNCYFILYSNSVIGNFETINEKKDGFIDKLHDLIGTGDRPQKFSNQEYSTQLEKLNKKQIEILATILAEHIKNSFTGRISYEDLLANRLMMRYHVILAQTVFNISDIQHEGDKVYRHATLRDEWFDSKEKFDVAFKKILPKEMQKKELYNTNFKDQPFKVPYAFGNKDVTEVRNILDFLLSKMEESKQNKVVNIKNGLSPLVDLSSAVGNLLVFDAETEMLKFVNSCDLLGCYSKEIWEIIQSNYVNFQDYRFNVKIDTFPILQINQGIDDLVPSFLDRLLIYSNQADEDGVMGILKSEIKDREYNLCNIGVKSDTIGLKYLNQIEREWKMSETKYLTRESKIYENAKNSINNDELISAMDMTYKLKNEIFDDTCFFNDDAVNSLELGDLNNSFSQDLSIIPRTVILTKVTLLTVLKVIQFLKKIKKEHVVLDLDYISDKERRELKTFYTELSDLNKNIVYLVVYEDKRDDRIKRDRFIQIVKAFSDKDIQLIIVTKDIAYESTKEYFSHITKEIVDEQNSWTDLSHHSQGQAKVLFQDTLTNLREMIGDEYIKSIKNDVLLKIYHKDTIVLGQPLSTSKYEEIKELYVNRRIISKRYKTCNLCGTKPIRSVRDLSELDHIGILTAPPGMGKSTLSTHLSIETKKLHSDLWIVRIDLLEYSAVFKKWREDKTKIDFVEMLHFLCESILYKNRCCVNLNNFKIELELRRVLRNKKVEFDIFVKNSTGDKSTDLEVEMFLHFYKTNKLIIIFDAFDEICPNYRKKVFELLKCVRDNLQDNKMWITCRSYNDLTSTLENEFGISYLLDSFNNKDENVYLYKFWEKVLVLEELKDKELDNVLEFFTSIKRLNKSNENKLTQSLIQVYLNGLMYLSQKLQNGRTKTTLTEQLAEHGSYIRNDIDIFSNGNDNGGNVTSIIYAYNMPHKNEDEIPFSSIPLHLNLIADSFQSQLKSEMKWDLEDNNMFFERLLRNKMQIRFRKNSMDENKPDTNSILERELINTIELHKKIAAYTLFHDNAYLQYELFDATTQIEIEQAIKKLRQGDEKSGIIYRITNENIPLFVHMVFAEFLGTYYICDLIKSNESEHKSRLIWRFFFQVFVRDESMNIYLNIIDNKLKYDKDLTRAILKSKNIMSEELKSAVGGSGINATTFYYELLSAVNNLNDQNCNNFISFIKEKLKKSREKASAKAMY